MCPHKTEHNSFKYIYKVFSLPFLHSNPSAEYKINYKYIGVTNDETKAVAISVLQYRTCQHANRQFCRINALFQPLANPPSCVLALYAKNDQAINEKCSLVCYGVYIFEYNKLNTKYNTTNMDANILLNKLPRVY